jgi:hypothetical protein
MIAFLDKLRSINDYTLYHFGNFETRALRHFRKRTNDSTLLAEIDNLMSKSVNVLSLFSQNVYPPTYTNGLKEIGSFLGFKWSTQDLSGLKSIVFREKWELEKLENYKRILVDYNLDDYTALLITKDLLSNIARRVTEGCEDLRSASDVQSTSFHKWGKPRFEIEELDVINKCSYFDYQRSKVYLRTNKAIRTALGRENKAKARINAVDKQIWLPERCPHCGGKEVHFASKIQRRRRILDLRFMKNGVKKWVTELLGRDFRCAACDNVFSVSMYGRNLIIWFMNQHITYRISVVRIGKMLRENYNIEVPEYKLSYLKRDLANEYRGTATGILQNFFRGPLIQIDETTAFVRDSPSTYVWVFASMDSVYYLLRKSREASFLHELIDGFNGVLVSDFYSGCDSLPCKQQRCLVHFIRDLNGDFRKNQFNSELKFIVVRFGKLLRTIVATIDQYGLRRRHLEKHLRDVDAFYLTIGEDQYDTDIAAQYQKRLTRNRARMF